MVRDVDAEAEAEEAGKDGFVAGLIASAALSLGGKRLLWEAALRIAECQLEQVRARATDEALLSSKDYANVNVNVNASSSSAAASDGVTRAQQQQRMVVVSHIDDAIGYTDEAIKSTAKAMAMNMACADSVGPSTAVIAGQGQDQSQDQDQDRGGQDQGGQGQGQGHMPHDDVQGSSWRRVIPEEKEANYNTAINAITAGTDTGADAGAGAGAGADDGSTRSSVAKEPPQSPAASAMPPDNDPSLRDRDRDRGRADGIEPILPTIRTAEDTANAALDPAGLKIFVVSISFFPFPLLSPLIS
jgi:hypothetical protein